MKIKFTIPLLFVSVGLCGLASAEIPSLLNYQGRIIVNGTNFDGAGQFKFSLVDGGSNTAHQATAIARASGGVITSMTVSFGGSGYLSAPRISIADAGSGALATAVLSNGIVARITLVNGGHGYSASPAVTIAPPPSNLAFHSFWCNEGWRDDGGEPDAAVTLPVNKGIYSVQPGDTALAHMDSLSPDIFTNADVRLRVWFTKDGNAFEQLSPDQRISAVGYAMSAVNANYAATSAVCLAVSPSIDVQGQRLNIGTNNILDGSWASIAGGISNAAVAWGATIGGGQSNSVSGVSATVSGGSRNVASGSYAFVGGGYHNQATGPGAVVTGGGYDGVTWSDPDAMANIASGTASFIGGGLRNHANEEYATIGAGLKNEAGHYATVAGGVGNKAVAYYAAVGGGDNNVASNLNATVGGGSENTALGSRATVSGGANNAAANDYSTVAGGSGNTASGIGATVGGGGLNGTDSSHGNLASGAASVIAGGCDNIASVRAATIGGGEQNRASGEGSVVAGGMLNQANGMAAFVGGGGQDYRWDTANTANGVASVIGGGVGNLANGFASVIPGGSHNETDGANSFAGGTHAIAAHDNTFVWNDGTGPNDSVASTRSNQFLINASGGVGINTRQTPQGGLVVNTSTFINDFDLFLRLEDTNCGLGWYGSGKPFGMDAYPDGPVLYGTGSGGLGISGANPQLALIWDHYGVSVPGGLSVGDIWVNGFSHFGGPAVFLDDVFVGPYNFNGIGSSQSGLVINTNAYINDHDLYFRTDQNYGVGWYDSSKLFGTNAISDGPVLYGYRGGALGTTLGHPRVALSWSDNEVTVEQNLSVNGILQASAVSVDGRVTADILNANLINAFGAISALGNVHIDGMLEVAGLKLFVAPYSGDTNKEIGYVAIEGPEAATFIRGTTNVTAGEVVISLPDHFGMVTETNGITVQLTPRGQYLQLYVQESSPSRIVIKEAQGKSGQFDYLVQGVRLGYANYQPVRPASGARKAGLSK